MKTYRDCSDNTERILSYSLYDNNIHTYLHVIQVYMRAVTKEIVAHTSV